jgi:hypothetical protein
MFTATLFIFSISHSDIPQVADGALWVLSRVPQIQFPPVISGVSEETALLGHILDMLKARNIAKWRYPVIFRMLSHLAFHNESNAIAIMEANVLISVEKLLRSRAIDLYQHIFPMLTSLASHESTEMAVVRILPLDLLVDMLKAPNTAKRCYPLIFHTLSHLTLHNESSAVAIVDAKVLTFVEKLLRSRAVDLYQHIFPMLASLASHESTAMPVVRMLPLDLLVDMLKDPNTAKQCYPLIFQTLSHLTFHNQSSAVAIVEADVLTFVEKLLRTRAIDLYQHIFPMLASLSSHESTAMAVVRMLPLDLLGTSLRCVSIHLHILQRFNHSSSQHGDGTLPSDSLWWQCKNLVTTKLLESPCQATAEATCGSLVALAW